MEDQTTTPSYYALLIGIDAYREKALNGCVRDVLEMQELLDNMQGCHVQVNVLTASVGPLPRSAEESRFWPSHERVTEILARMISESKAGDFVYIHYSGHGTSMAPPPKGSPSRAFSNPSTGDLALNLLEKDTNNVQYLRGGELAELLQQMTDKKLMVTVVLDCCFSGSLVRDDASVRYLKYNAAVDKAHPPIPGQTLSPRDELRRPAYRNASLGPNWLVNPTNYTVITACGPTEEAKEMSVNGVHHGAMSYFLCDTFRELRGIGGKHLYLHQCLRSRLLNARPEKPLNQNPMWYGSKNLNFLGRANALTEAVPIPFIRNRIGELRLGAGQAHGICEGDQLAVRAVGFEPLTKHHFVTHKTLCTTQVASVGPLTSSLSLSDTEFQRNTDLAATVLTNLSLKKVPVQLSIGTPLPEGWLKTLDEHQTLDIYQASSQSDTRDCPLSIILTDDGWYEIQSIAGETLVRLDTLPSDPGQRAALVLRAAEHLAKFQLLKNMNSGLFANPDHRFRNSFEIHLIGPNQEKKRYAPGCRRNQGHQTVCSHSDCVIEVEDGDRLQLEVKNLETPGGHAICVHLLDLGPLWEISNILEGDYEVVPTQWVNDSKHFKNGTGGLWEYEIEMEVPSALHDKGECEDIIKVFVTSRPTSLLAFELPELDQVLRRKDVYEHRGSGSGLEIDDFFSLVEDWVAVSFRIRTRL